jgi:hypothetical protein
VPSRTKLFSPLLSFLSGDANKDIKHWAVEHRLGRVVGGELAIRQVQLPHAKQSISELKELRKMSNTNRSSSEEHGPVCPCCAASNVVMSILSFADALEDGKLFVSVAKAHPTMPFTFVDFVHALSNLVEEGKIAWHLGTVFMLRKPPGTLKRKTKKRPTSARSAGLVEVSA